MLKNSHPYNGKNIAHIQTDNQSGSPRKNPKKTKFEKPDTITPVSSDITNIGVRAKDRLYSISKKRFREIQSGKVAQERREKDRLRQKMNMRGGVKKPRVPERPNTEREKEKANENTIKINSFAAPKEQRKDPRKETPKPEKSPFQETPENAREGNPSEENSSLYAIPAVPVSPEEKTSPPQRHESAPEPPATLSESSKSPETPPTQETPLKEDISSSEKTAQPAPDPKPDTSKKEAVRGAEPKTIKPQVLWDQRVGEKNTNTFDSDNKKAINNDLIGPRAQRAQEGAPSPKEPSGETTTPARETEKTTPPNRGGVPDYAPLYNARFSSDPQKDPSTKTPQQTPSETPLTNKAPSGEKTPFESPEKDAQVKVVAEKSIKKEASESRGVDTGAQSFTVRPKGAEKQTFSMGDETWEKPTDRAKEMKAPPISVPQNQKEKPASQNIEEPPLEETSSLPWIRTYQNDMKKARENHGGKAPNQTPVASGNESGKPAQKKQKITSPKNIALVLLSTLLIFGTLGMAYYVYVLSSPPPTQVVAPAPIIRVSETARIDVNTKSGQKLYDELYALKRRQLASQEIRAILPVASYIVESREGQKTLYRYITPGNFLSALEANTPIKLRQSLTDKGMFGIFSTAQSQHPFIILKTTSYDDAYREMRQWEKDLAREFLKWFDTQSSQTLDRIIAKNILLQNNDVRILSTGAGKTLLLYAFTDQSTIVITNNKETLLELFRRLKESQ